MREKDNPLELNTTPSTRNAIPVVEVMVLLDPRISMVPPLPASIPLPEVVLMVRVPVLKENVLLALLVSVIALFDDVEKLLVGLSKLTIAPLEFRIRTPDAVDVRFPVWKVNVPPSMLSTSNRYPVLSEMDPEYVIVGVLLCTIKAVPLGFVMVAVSSNVNVPPEPARISIPASPPFKVNWSGKL